jgi:hypothetical protein
MHGSHMKEGSGLGPRPPSLTKWMLLGWVDSASLGTIGSQAGTERRGLRPRV